MGFNDNIFSNQKVGKVLLKFAIPIVISMLVAELYNMVDTIFVGRYVNANAIGALTIAFPVQRLVAAVGLLIAVGTSTLVARSLGEKNLNKLKTSIINAFCLTLVSISLIIVILFNLRKTIIFGLGASQVIYPFADEYIKFILIGGLFQCMSIVISYIMTALGNTKITLYTNIVGCIANIIIDYLFVAVLGLGVTGAALATVISQLLSFIFVLYNFREVKRQFKIKFTFKLSFNAKIMWTIIAIGFSTFVVEISDAIDSAVLNNLLFSKGGDSAIIIVGVVTKLSMFLYITIIGISSAMQPIIAYNYGAKNYKKVRETLKVSIKVIAITSIALWGIFMIFARPMIGSFLKEQTLMPQAVNAFRISMLVLPVVSLYYISIYYYQAIGQSKKSFLLSIYRQIVVFIPATIMLIGKFGVLGAWITYPTVDIIAFITSIYFIKQAKNLGKETEEERFEADNKSFANA